MLTTHALSATLPLILALVCATAQGREPVVPRPEGAAASDTLCVPTDPSSAVLLRVIDTGPGLAVVARAPGGHHLVYDAGHWDRDDLVLARIAEVVPAGEEIDLMILSHSDSDHLGAVDEILGAYPVRRVIHTGYERPNTVTWREARDAIAAAVASGGTAEVNLRDHELPPGATYRLGAAFVTVVSGFHEPPSDWTGISGEAKRRNAVSVMARLYYEGRSVLLAGDAVGRVDDAAPDAAPVATEAYALGNLPIVPLQADVLVAPHHGADNASASAFIEAVDPLWVVFSAGHAHEHPRATTAARYLAAGVPAERMLRTDLGDDEGGGCTPSGTPDGACEGEWEGGRVEGASDTVGDDDIDVWLTDTRNVWVGYRDHD